MVARVVQKGWSLVLVVLMMIFITQRNFAGDIQVSWQANREPDLAGYKIYYGTSSRNYSQHVDVGNQTTYVLRNFEDGIEYFFALTAYDTAGNESDYSAEISGVLGDSTQPVIVSATLASASEVLVTFSKKLDKATAQDINHYRIDHGITVNLAVLQKDRKTVRLVTSKHTANVNYTLSVKQIRDIAIPPNTIADGASVQYTFRGEAPTDTTPPTLVLANLSSATDLLVYFNEPLNKSTAENIKNYFIDHDLQIFSAVLDTTGTIVHLSTAEHASGIAYVLTVNNVSDNAGNVIAENSSYAYSWQPGDVVGPVITLVSVPAQDAVEVMFNEPLEQSSAEDASNYNITGGASVITAKLDESRQIVHLQTTAHEPDHLYLLNVKNVRDVSVNRNAVAPNTSYAYLYEPLDRTGPTITRVEVKDAAHLKVAFNEALEPTSAENARNYQISEGIQVLRATLDVTGKAVDLETTNHQEGKVYILLVSEVKDASGVGNEIIPNSSYTYVYGSLAQGLGPTIVQVHPTDATTLVVEFSKALNEAGAQNINNYVLNRSSTVTSASLDANGTRVVLTTTPMEADRVYILTVNHVMDAENNSILPNSSYSFVYEGEDTIGPVMTLVKVVDRENIDVLFNEQLDQASAEDVNHYAINGGINVLGARLDGSRRVVHLHTLPHSTNKLYILRVSDVTDASAAKNPIAPNSSYTYVYEAQDAVAPTIAMVRILSAEQLQVIFSEAMDLSNLTEPSNFALNNDAKVLAAEQGENDFTVNLKTSVLESGQVYVLMVNHVKDAAGNEILSNSAYTFAYGNISATSAPTITAVQVEDESHVKIVFNVPLDALTAENVAHYRILPGLKVNSASLDSSRQAVILQTEAHEPEKQYMILVTGVARFDDATQKIRSPAPYFYIYDSPVTSLPAVESVRILGETLIEVRFTRAVERLSAENRHNYHSNGGITILSAELDESGKRVLLETSRHRAGVAYTLNISGIRGARRESSMQVVSATVAYTYLPNLQVEVDTDAEVSLSFANVGKEYYLDRNYVITSVPEDLAQARLLMTVNDDKANTETRFITLHLSEPAFVYIAYDSRALSVPNWLDAHFTKTEMWLGVSDNAEKLTLWQGYFPAGKVVLGGNNSIGARGVKSMYVVLILEPTFAQMPGDGPLEGSSYHGASIPSTVELLPNYPNPFNPTTSIGFDLPGDRHVRLIIYNILGRQVKMLYDALASAGRHVLVWDGTNEEMVQVAAGIYFYRLEAWEDIERNGMPVRQKYITFTRKMTFLK